MAEDLPEAIRPSFVRFSAALSNLEAAVGALGPPEQKMSSSIMGDTQEPEDEFHTEEPEVKPQLGKQPRAFQSLRASEGSWTT